MNNQPVNFLFSLFSKLISSILNSLKKRNRGAEKANAIVKVVKTTIHKFFISNLFDSDIIQIKVAEEPTRRSLDKDCEAGLLFAKSINNFKSNVGPYILANSIFARVGNMAPIIARNK